MFIKKILPWVLMTLIFMLTLAGCTGQEKQNTEAIISLAELNKTGMKIGVPTGAKSDEVAQEQFPNAEIVQYRNIGEGFIALKTGKIDAFCFVKNIMRYVVNQNPDLTLIEEAVALNEMAIGVRLDNTDLMNEINSVIKTFNENGVREEMENRWTGLEFYPDMPDIEPTANPERTLTIGIPDENPPMSYTDAQGNISGFDAEYALRLGKELNAAVEFSVMEWSAIIPSLQSGKVDIIIANLNITEERRQSMLLSDVYVETDIVMMVRKGENDTPGQLIPEDWVGKSIGVITGTVHDQVIEKYFPGAQPVYFNDVQSILMSLENGRIDGMLSDESDFKIFGPKYPGLRLLEPYFDEGSAGMLVSKEKPELLGKINAFLALIKADGTHEEMFERWIGGDETMPDIPEGTGEVLRMGTSGIADGFAFYKDGEIVGIDVEFAKRFAAHENMRLEITVFDFAGLIPALQSGKIDYAASCFAITEERAELANYTDPYYTTARAIAVYDTPLNTDRVSFLQSVKTSFERNLIRENRWKMIVEGLQVSMIITLLAFALATLLGFGICGLRMNKNPILIAIGKIYVTILRGTPIVVLLMITFYVIFAKSSISGTMVAVIAFGVNGAAFIGEIIRSAILTIDKGQIEAARSMGFSKIGAFFTVTFPQAARVAFPVYMSEFISLFKMTSVVGYIAVVDLTKAGDIIRSRTYDAFFPLLFVALVYLAAASLMIWVFGAVERMTNKRLRRKAK